jgi:hypothetical protein
MRLALNGWLLPMMMIPRILEERSMFEFICLQADAQPRYEVPSLNLEVVPSLNL